MRNDGTGRFTRDSTDVPYETIAVGRAVTTLDVNGDGLVDVYYGQSREEEGYSTGFPNLVLVQQGGTLVDMAPTLLDPYVAEFTHAVVSADIDCDGYGAADETWCRDVDLDGWPDIVYSSGIEGACTIFINAGDGYFSEHPMGGTETCGRYFPMDANGDGRTDLFMLRSTGMLLSLNDG